MLLERVPVRDDAGPRTPARCQSPVRAADGLGCHPPARLTLERPAKLRQGRGDRQRTVLQLARSERRFYCVVPL